MDTKIIEVESKIPDYSRHITSEEFNKLTWEHYVARLKQADWLNKTDFNDKLTSFNKRIASNKRKHLEVQNKLNSLDKNYNNFETTCFNYAMIFLKLIDWWKLGDIYINHNSCLGHMLIT